jgi:hypothetical protein
MADLAALQNSMLEIILLAEHHAAGRPMEVKSLGLYRAARLQPVSIVAI